MSTKNTEKSAKKVRIVNTTKSPRRVLPTGPRNKLVPNLSRTVLVPGGTDVELEVWEQIKKHPVVKAWIERGILKETEQGVGREAGAEAAPPTLEGVEGEKLDFLIDATNDLQVLETWLRSERRKEVAKKIEEKLALVRAA